MKTSANPHVIVKLQKPKPSVVFDTYWKFACRRQEAFFARLSYPCGPWTEDPILKAYKFTNAYRASDRVSQYLIKNVIYSQKWSVKDTVFRTLLFKIFNKIETWELLESQFGEVSIESFDVSKYDKVLSRAMQAGGAIYSAAYIMPSGPKSKCAGLRKHQFHLSLLQSLLNDGFVERLLACVSMEQAYKEILKIESFGKFLSYQFVTDLNYSNVMNFSETEFVVPGPGALDGIKKCFITLGDYNEQDVIKMVMNEQEHHFERLGENFKFLWGRKLQLIDCQNLFCEVDKYSRVAHPDIEGISGRTRIKQKFKPRSREISVWYPPKWRINHLINEQPNSLEALAM